MKRLELRCGRSRVQRCGDIPSFPGGGGRALDLYGCGEGRKIAVDE